MFYETLHQIFDSFEAFLKENKVESSEWNNYLCTGGVGYGESIRLHFEIDHIAGRFTKDYAHCIITRFNDGCYELVNYIF